MTGPPGRLSAALVALLAASAAAQDAAAPPEGAPPEEAPLAGTDPAVGRLNRAGYNRRMHCTASLLGPAEAVTARHCVEGGPAGEHLLILGYDRGEYAERLRVRSVQASETADIARLCLETPSEAPALPASRGRPAPAPQASVRGYPRTRAHAQDLRFCALAPVPGEPLAALDCPLEQGFSGAPVRSPGELGPVIGVASASGAEGSLVALLEALPEGGC